jgi:hypothetical protein
VYIFVSQGKFQQRNLTIPTEFENMAKESVLTQAEKDSFKIKRFIFHIIKQSELNPIFLDEVSLDEGQTKFFQDRFGDVSQGTQFEFTNKDTSDFYKKCIAIIENPEEKFLEISKDLTASFKSHHINKSTNDGVFITALVSVMDKTDLIFLIKLDNRKVYGYSIEDKKALMQEIKNTFVEDPRAVQKIAIINVVDFRVWDVIARDRSAITGKSIRDFFANFLTVRERETPSTLTTKTIREVRKWANAHKAALSQEPSSYKKRCVEYLRNHTEVKFPNLINMVIHDEDLQRKKTLQKSLKKHLEDIGLYGQIFAPNSGSIKDEEKKTVYQTAEGVKIEWEGKSDAKDVNVVIPNIPSPNDGRYHITIMTSAIEEIK